MSKMSVTAAAGLLTVMAWVPLQSPFFSFPVDWQLGVALSLALEPAGCLGALSHAPTDWEGHSSAVTWSSVLLITPLGATALSVAQIQLRKCQPQAEAEGHFRRRARAPGTRGWELRIGLQCWTY